MMEFPIHKFLKAGPIQFGATRSEVRKHFSEEPKVYAQSEAELPHDTYEELGLYVIYDKYNRCAAVEFMNPHQLIWEGKNLFEMSFNEIFRYFYQQDDSMAISAKDFVSFNLGISAFAPDKETNPEAKIESITVFRKDHFNQKIGVCDPSVFSTFLLQIGQAPTAPFGSFRDLPSLWKASFGSQNDYLFMYWNSQPVAIPYKEIHALAPVWLLLVSQLTDRPQGQDRFVLNSESVKCTWEVSWDDGYVTIQSKWGEACGMDAALNEWSDLKVLKSDFISEWTLLFHQLSIGLQSLNATASRGENSVLLDVLQELLTRLEQPGRWYRLESRQMTKHFEPV